MTTTMTIWINTLYKKKEKRMKTCAFLFYRKLELVDNLHHLFTQTDSVAL